MPAAERPESLPGHHSGACGSADAQVDSIVGKFLGSSPETAAELRIDPWWKALRENCFKCGEENGRRLHCA